MEEYLGVNGRPVIKQRNVWEGMGGLLSEWVVIQNSKDMGHSLIDTMSYIYNTSFLMTDHLSFHKRLIKLSFLLCHL